MLADLTPIITIVGGQAYVVWPITETSIITVAEDMSCSILLVGGGGGGGGGGGYSNGGGGGGAGGVREIHDVVLTAGEYTATVGLGGAGNKSYTWGVGGGSTSFAGYTAAGGGGGAPRLSNSTNYVGHDGACGGGGARAGGGGSGNVPATDPVQGYNGFAASASGCGGGGGGAGTDHGVTARSPGGDGRLLYFRSDAGEYFGGGGGGGGYNSGFKTVPGGLGGGGNGEYDDSGNPGGMSGVDGLGGGGGGSSSTATTSGAGGSGILIIRKSIAIVNGTILDSAGLPCKRSVLMLSRPTLGGSSMHSITESDTDTGQYSIGAFGDYPSIIVLDDSNPAVFMDMVGIVDTA